MKKSGFRTHLLAISVGVHVAIAVGLAAIPTKARHEIVAIAFSTEKPKPKAEPAKEPEPPPPEPAAHPVRAKTLSAPKPAPASEAKASEASGDAPDFGLSLSSGGGGGLAVRAGGPVNAAPAATASPKLLRHASAAADECNEPPAKPKLLTRPTPAYSDDARAAGVSGKVRVEITVDETGKIVDVHLLQGLGHGLDEAALAAARGMTFEPATRCGKRSRATFKIAFNFSPASP